MKHFALLIALVASSLQLRAAEADWITLFDGKSLNGWQGSENTNTWRVEDGTLISRGGRSHLFYMGEVSKHEFKNFEFRAEAKTTPGSNSGIFVHTHYQETDFPADGYECQVINSSPNVRPGAYVERKMTGSIYAIRNTWKTPVKDNEWFHYRIVVQGKTLRTYINEELIAEYTEPANAFRPADKKGRLLNGGTFALQGHDPGSVVAFRNLQVKILPDDLPTPGKSADDRTFDARLIQLSNDNFPLLDLNVRLARGLTADQALENSRKYGYTYGFVFDGPPPTNFRKPPQAFIGRKIAETESASSVRDFFDYVIADTLTLPRVALPEDGRVFVDALILRIEKLATNSGLTILASATALPENFMPDYDALWTPDRMDRVIKALKDGKVAMEINDRLQVPSAAFIKHAKAAGIKFTFGTGNTGPDDLAKMAYCITMITECKLTATDLWLPEAK